MKSCLKYRLNIAQKISRPSGTGRLSETEKEREKGEILNNEIKSGGRKQIKKKNEEKTSWMTY